MACCSRCFTRVFSGLCRLSPYAERSWRPANRYAAYALVDRSSDGSERLEHRSRAGPKSVVDLQVRDRRNDVCSALLFSLAGDLARQIDLRSDHFHLHVVETVHLELEVDALLFMVPFAGLGAQLSTT